MMPLRPGPSLSPMTTTRRFILSFLSYHALHPANSIRYTSLHLYSNALYAHNFPSPPNSISSI